MKQIVKIELQNIDSFKDHPFKVQRDDSLILTFLNQENKKKRARPS